MGNTQLQYNLYIIQIAAKKYPWTQATRGVKLKQLC